MRALAALALTAAVAGCAGPAAITSPGSLPSVDALPAWSASGRIAIAADGEGGSGSFTWRQDDVTTRLGLRGPLGAGGLEVLASPDALHVTDAAGREFDTGAASAELRMRLGTDVPWSSLRFWMLGLPDPQGPARVEERPDAPRRVIEQGGWRIGYENYTVAGGYALPQRFVATRGAVRVKIVVDDWSLRGEPARAAGAPP
jgi:outer membrane lipoprotein LolB